MANSVNQIVKSRRIGMKDLYVAPVTQDEITGYTAGTPIQLARAISAKITTKKTVTNEYSDDSLEESIETFDSATISLNINDLSPEMEALLLGATYDENGFLVDSATDISNPVALGWRDRRSDGKYEFIWLYVCRFNEGNESDYETIEDKVKAQTPTLKGSIIPRQIDQKWRIRVNESYLLANNTGASTAIKDWFGQVQEPTALNMQKTVSSPTTVVEPMNSSTPK